MWIRLQNFSGDKRVVDKTSLLSLWYVDISGTMRFPLDILRPTIDIDLSAISDAAEKAHAEQANYCYISTLDRYYFIVGKTYINDKIISLSMVEDVLFTWETEIKALTEFVDRSESDKGYFLEDEYVNCNYQKLINETLPTHSADIISMNLPFVKFDWTLASNPPANEDYKFAVTCFSYVGNGIYAVNKQIPPKNLGLPEIETLLENGNDNHLTTFITESSGIVDVIKNCVHKPSEIGTFVGSIIAFPFPLTDIGNFTALTSIKVGENESISLSAYPAYHDNSFNDPNDDWSGGAYIHYMIVDCWDTSSASSYWDYEPYTTYEIYLPFVGYVKVDAVNYLNRRIWVLLSVNLKDGSATYLVYTGHKNTTDVFDPQKCKLIFSKDFKLGIEIPISSSNKQANEAKKESQAIGFAVGELTSLAQTALGAVTKNPMMIAKGAFGMANTATGFFSSLATMLSSGSVNLGSSGSSNSSPMEVRIRLTTLVPRNTQNEIAPYYGLPCKKEKTLTSLTGMTIISNPKLSSMGNAMESEKEEIRKAMQTGIIL